MTDKTTTIILTAIALVAVTGTTSAFATHVSNVEDYEWHIWSRTTGDGHRGYLNCGTGSQSDNCDLKIQTTSRSIQEHSQSVINDEVDAIEGHFDSLGKKMSIDRVSYADSYITRYNLPSGVTGTSEYELHCTNPGWWWWQCNAEDSHFEKMVVKINDNPTEIKFKLQEDATANPQEYDIRKTLTHELFHAMGIDHNSSSSSIVYYTYVFGSNGYTATTTDRNDLEARYP